jgi:hypothetical protein
LGGLTLVGREYSFSGTSLDEILEKAIQIFRSTGFTVAISDLVINQAGIPPCQIVPWHNGPTLERVIWPSETGKTGWLKTLLTMPNLEAPKLVPAEYNIRLQLQEEQRKESQEHQTAGTDSAHSGGNKIGGTPWFLQGPKYPDGGHWYLLLQLDSTDVPFQINFGDAGIGYAFISVDGHIRKFLWQCA